MKIKERNLDGEIVEREVINPSFEKLQEENCELIQKINSLELTLSLVCAKELSTIPTHELIIELNSRLHVAMDKAEKYDKLQVKHNKAAAYIAELKNNQIKGVEE